MTRAPVARFQVAACRDRDEDGAFEILARMHALTELQHLPGHEGFDLVRLEHPFSHREVRVLRRQRPQKSTDRRRVAMRQGELGILGVELESVTGLAVRRESNALIIAPLRVGLMTIIAL